MEMKLHQLKILDEYYIDVESGEKTFELRKDDRDYEVDDLINFIRIDKKGNLINTDFVYQIVYILRDCPKYGLLEGYAILGIRQCGKLISWPHIK